LSLKNENSDMKHRLINCFEEEMLVCCQNIQYEKGFTSSSLFLSPSVLSTQKRHYQ